MKKTGIFLTAAIMLAACRQASNIPHQEQLLQATTWFQQSAEMEALFYQAYNWATVMLDEQIALKHDKPLAVVLDIDETVLNNSPQTAQQIIDGEPYSDAFWEEWCMLAQAEPTPGSLDFTRMAADRGVEIFYISNRKIHLLDVTLRNLREKGFPNADSAHVLLNTDTSVKDARREKVREYHDIVLLIGDNLRDFSGIFDNREGDACQQQVRENRQLFGQQYIILPNPMYGTWERPFQAGGPEESNALKRSALKGFRP
jgi:5'-nucleotidase (lipoprotein e(P4) family)